MMGAWLGLILFGYGLALAGEPTPSNEGEPKAVEACFRVRDTRSFDAVDDRFVYVRCIRDRHYLLTMDNACFGLENSIAVAVSNRFDRVCSNDRAWITYKDFNQTRRCGILSVEAVESREAALELIKKRKETSAAGREGKTVAPDHPD
jgi:hypothetical protein